MSTLNKAMIIGRLGEDPDVRYTQSNTAVANLSIATSERYENKNGERKENTEWHRVVAWGRLAEICQEYLQKGSQVYIEGNLQTRKWEDKEGQSRYTTEIKARTMTMLDSKGESNTPSNAPNDRGNQPTAQGGIDSNEDFDDIDDDLPFSWVILLMTAGSYASMLV